jgi:hypothetical protein
MEGSVTTDCLKFYRAAAVKNCQVQSHMPIAFAFGIFLLGEKCAGTYLKTNLN